MSPLWSKAAFDVAKKGSTAEVVGAAADRTMDEISGEYAFATTPETTFDDDNPGIYELLPIAGGFLDGAPATVPPAHGTLALTRSFATRNKVASRLSLERSELGRTLTPL